jgi:hypothetical protein
LEAGVREGIIVERVQQLINELVQTTIPFRAKVFFSYSHSDAEIVRAVARGLRDRGIDTWIDVENIHLGLSLHDTIASGIQTADFMVFFVSKQTAGRSWLEHELRLAMSRRLSGEHDMVMIPALLDDVEVPALLRDIKYLDLRDRDIDRAVEELSNAIRAHLKRRERVDESG